MQRRPPRRTARARVLARTRCTTSTRRSGWRRCRGSLVSTTGSRGRARCRVRTVAAAPSPTGTSNCCYRPRSDQPRPRPVPGLRQSPHRLWDEARKLGGMAQFDRAHTDNLLTYLSAAPTPYHAVAEAASLLDKGGFRQLSETAAWDAQPGGQYVIRGGALVAWYLP